MCEGASPARWLVEYAPVVELHHSDLRCDPAQRAAEIVARNGIHAGVVRQAGEGKVCKLEDVPLDSPIRVMVDGELREAPVLRDLELDGAYGPLATVSWLARRLEADSGAEEGLRAGQLILTATPGSLIPVSAGRVSVSFDGMEVGCTVDPRSAL